MSEWKEYKLGTLCDVRDGTHDSPKESHEGYPLVTSKNIKNGKIDLSNTYLISESDYNFVNQRSKVDQCDILFSMIGTIGESAIVKEEPKYAIKNVGLFKTHGNKLLASWIYYYFHSLQAKEEMNACIKGSTQQYVSLTDLRNFPVEMPSEDYRRKVVSILSSLDDKIDLLNRENATLEAMAETLFRQWFIEEAKEDWEERPLGDVALLNAGGDKPSIVSQNRTKELNVPIYSNGIDNEGLYGYTDKPRITEESVTISARGTIGYVALRTESFVPIVRLITIRPKERVTSMFLYFWAKSQDINGTGTTQQQLTVPDFKQTKLVLPDKAVIDDFTKIANQYYDKIISNKKQIQTLIHTRDGLLPKLMSNEISIK